MKLFDKPQKCVKIRNIGSKHIHGLSDIVCAVLQSLPDLLRSEWPVDPEVHSGLIDVMSLHTFQLLEAAVQWHHIVIDQEDFPEE